MNTIIVIPTYNEADNIAETIHLIRENVKVPVEILVVDSNSPDGTAAVIENLQHKDGGIHLIKQPRKMGLGKAYLEGMHWALNKNYDILVTMDADFSHNPIYINEMLRLAQSKDIVVGSRYMEGGGLQAWPLQRRILSRVANWYARNVTALPYRDLTSGFQAIRTALLRKILARPITTEGYAFLVELKFRAIMEGGSFDETPIVFMNRTRGYSKISKKIIFESILFVTRLGLQRQKIKEKAGNCEG